MLHWPARMLSADFIELLRRATNPMQPARFPDACPALRRPAIRDPGGVLLGFGASSARICDPGTVVFSISIQRTMPHAALAGTTKLSMTRFSPALSKLTVS